ncbi:protein NDRG3 isoform X2 [Condylostylus longicornis]|uniref:protein NDRG3 isoform X2 n=1 Tax=Condylostylus longicornis TaxID=2530218 RepID=UPI00244DE95B|nr:protein NDRG3 isoform X2 [Condylostylus longicornis]
MPQKSEGGYVSLGNVGPKSVYNATTEPNGPPSVFESVKRAIGQVVGNTNNNTNNFNGSSMDTALLGIHDGEQPIIVSASAMPIDPMDDIELRSVQLQFPHARGSILEACEQKRVPTDKGDILVAIQGDASKPPIITYHDLGLNYATSFAGFFNFPVMRGLLENFCVYHVTAPGQEEGAATLPEDYIYPTMDELAAQLLFVMSHFQLKNIIGFGVGAGANILARFAIQNPDKVGALCLINCVSTASGWIEWGYQSFNARYLRTKGMTQSVIDYLMWHHFGRNPEERNHDLVQLFKAHFERGVNPNNLAMFINSYIHRSDLNIARTPPGNGPQSAATLKMPVINVTGALSPHVDDTVTLNGRLDPTNSTWMKISDCAMVLEEQPAKLAEAFRLFLQGEGYATPLSTPATTPTSGRYRSSIFYSGNYRTSNKSSPTTPNDNNEITSVMTTASTITSSASLSSSSNINSTNIMAKLNGIAATTLTTSPFNDDDDDNGNNVLIPEISNTSATSTIMNKKVEIIEEDINFNTSVGIVTVSTTPSTKIRITENPLPETVAC